MWEGVCNGLAAYIGIHVVIVRLVFLLLIVWTAGLGLLGYWVLASSIPEAQTADERARTLAAIAEHLPSTDLVIGTAQIPGKPAPELITGAMLERMRPGSVVVDLAAETGGNCAVTRPGERVEVGPPRMAHHLPRLK